MNTLSLIITNLAVTTTFFGCVKPPPTINRAPKENVSDKIGADNDGNSRQEKGKPDANGSNSADDSVPRQEIETDQRERQFRPNIPRSTRDSADPGPGPENGDGREPSRGSGLDSVTARISLPGTSINGTLANWYSQKQNYSKVESEVLKFYSHGSTNGCVAYLSTALRNIGVDIPLEVRGEESPSLLTKPFSRYLENKLNWRRIDDSYSLRRGDVVFTKDAKGYPGYPAHTYMFLKWINISKGDALVIDNRAFTHQRGIFVFDGKINVTPFAYALRAN